MRRAIARRVPELPAALRGPGNVGENYELLDSWAAEERR